ncbi:hypothetical protein B0H14DRAFT_3852330 [Mycena olivaceomarginata]|nr:hypothetical protein B0H14DRAFT_3852330 [Mycena olivaceomarginata]
MKFSTTLATLVFASFVSANSGIFSPDGQVLPSQIERIEKASEPEGDQWGSYASWIDASSAGTKVVWYQTADVSVALRTLQVNVQCFVASGVIQISRASDGVPLGYVRNTFDGQKSYTFGSLANALVVTLPASPCSGAFDLVATNGPDAAHTNVGAVGGSGGYDFSSGNLGYAYLAGTGHTNANSPPSSSAGTSIQSLSYNGPSESQIWSLNCDTRAITAQWTNTDSTNPATGLFYDPPVDFLGLIGDFTKFTNTFTGEGAFLVTATFVLL